MSLPSLKLVSFTLCPYVQRAVIVLLEKNIKHEVEYIDLSSPPPWFFDISPLEKVPVLLVDNKPLFESIPIIEFIDDISPGSLYPADPFEKAQQKAWMEFGDDTLSIIYNYYTTKDQMSYKQHHNTIMDRLDILEEIVANGPYFAGARFTMVDVVYGPLFRYFKTLESLVKEDYFTETPAVKNWSEHLLARESVQNSVPASYHQEIQQYVRKQDSVFAQRIQLESLPANADL